MFIRSKAHPYGRMLSIETIRLLIIALYFLYPLGCLLQLAPVSGDAGKWLAAGGLLMVVAALIAFAVLAGSSLQRQVQEPESELDERESSERNRAAFQAHSIFSAIVLMGVLYMMLTTDMAEAGKLDLWRPITGAHWNAIFGGLILLSFTLPGAMLAFRSSAADKVE
jgi:H+/gluconate symporter-like permease